MMVHLVARARPGRFPLSDPDRADWLWKALRRAFPEALGVTLMPNHVHVVLDPDDPDTAALRLARVLSAFSKVFKLGELWSSVPAPQPIADVDKLRRQLRYLALNPCRPWGRGEDPLVTDPLQWPWSTHRDVMGAIAPPWVSAERLAAALGNRRQVEYFRNEHHRYVSGDPSVSVRGTEPPRPAPPRRTALVPLAEVASAALAATRAPESALRNRGRTRDLFLCMARHQAWTDIEQLASACGCSRWTVYRAWDREDPPLLAAGLLCLGDPRLRWRPIRGR